MQGSTGTGPRGARRMTVSGCVLLPARQPPEEWAAPSPLHPANRFFCTSNDRSSKAYIHSKLCLTFLPQHVVTWTETLCMDERTFGTLKLSAMYMAAGPCC